MIDGLMIDHQRCAAVGLGSVGLEINRRSLLQLMQRLPHGTCRIREGTQRLRDRRAQGDVVRRDQNAAMIDNVVHRELIEQARHQLKVGGNSRLDLGCVGDAARLQRKLAEPLQTRPLTDQVRQQTLGSSLLRSSSRSIFEGACATKIAARSAGSNGLAMPPDGVDRQPKPLRQNAHLLPVASTDLDLGPAGVRADVTDSALRWLEPLQKVTSQLRVASASRTINAIWMQYTIITANVTYG